MTESDLSGVVITRSETALWRRMFDGVVVLGPLADRPLQISSPGYAIWQLLEHPTTVREIADVLAANFNENYDRISADVMEVVRGLDAVGAIAPPLSVTA